MEDILQRRSKDGDVFVVLAGENSKHLRIGVQVNGSIFYYEEGRLGNGYVRSTYLIENPTEQELIVKEKIQKLLEEKENSELEEKMKKEAEQYCELCRSYFFKCDLENLNASKNKELIELALENIDKAIELNPSCADYYDTRSLILSLVGYDNEALRNAFIASTLRNP